MADEYKESDMFFSESDSNTSDPSDSDSDSAPRNLHSNYRLKRENNAITSRNSAPVNIKSGISWVQCVDRDTFDDLEYGNGEFMPPHLIINRRVAGKMAFSVCSGNGRTLKGRDMRQVRNSILRMTGFLES